MISVCVATHAMFVALRVDDDRRARGFALVGCSRRLVRVAEGVILGNDTPPVSLRLADGRYTRSYPLHGRYTLTITPGHTSYVRYTTAQARKLHACMHILPYPRLTSACVCVFDWCLKHRPFKHTETRLKHMPSGVWGSLDLCRPARLAPLRGQRRR